LDLPACPAYPDGPPGIQRRGLLRQIKPRMKPWRGTGPR